MFVQTVLNPQVLSDLSVGVWWHFYSLFVVFKVQTTCSLVEHWWLLSVVWKERWCALIWKDKRGADSIGTCRLYQDERGTLENRSGIRHAKPVFTFTLRLDRDFDLKVLYSLEFIVCWIGRMTLFSPFLLWKEKGNEWFQTWVSLVIYIYILFFNWKKEYCAMWIWLFITPQYLKVLCCYQDQLDFVLIH